MGFDAQDKEIVRLITKLKHTDGAYPPELLAARRQRYLKQMGEIGLVVGAGTGLKNAIQSGKATISSATSTVLESALLVAIVAETGTVAYFYRDKLADLFHTITNSKEVKVQQASPSPVQTEPEILGVTPSSAVASTLPSSTLVPNVAISPTEVELSSTPIPDVVENNNTVSANSTEAPKDDNGHHYGQTPQPVRTKESKSNNNNPPEDNSNPPKDDTKPPKKK